MIKWKCHNCDTKFTSDNYDYYLDEAREHAIDCLGLEDFIELIEDTKSNNSTTTYKGG